MQIDGENINTFLPHLPAYGDALIHRYKPLYTVVVRHTRFSVPKNRRLYFKGELTCLLSRCETFMYTVSQKKTSLVLHTITMTYTKGF